MPNIFQRNLAVHVGAAGQLAHSIAAERKNFAAFAAAFDTDNSDFPVNGDSSQLARYLLRIWQTPATRNAT